MHTVFRMVHCIFVCCTVFLYAVLFSSCVIPIWLSMTSKLCCFPRASYVNMVWHTSLCGMNSWFFRTLHVHFSYSLVFLFRTPYVFSFFIYILLWPAKPYDFIQPGECTRVVFLMSYFSFLHRAVLFVRHTLIRDDILVCVVLMYTWFFRTLHHFPYGSVCICFVCHTYFRMPYFTDWLVRAVLVCTGDFSYAAPFFVWLGVYVSCAIRILCHTSLIGNTVLCFSYTIRLFVCRTSLYVMYRWFFVRWSVFRMAWFMFRMPYVFSYAILLWPVTPCCLFRTPCVYSYAQLPFGLSILWTPWSLKIRFHVIDRNQDEL